MPIINHLPHTGGETATLLWENSSPTASYSGAAETLSDAYTNFEKLRIVYRLTTSNSEEQTVDFTIQTDGNPGFRYGTCCTNSSGNPFARNARLTNSTTITFSACRQNGGTTTSNTMLIPVAIYGIK